jgi:hypothetical protein
MPVLPSTPPANAEEANSAEPPPAQTAATVNINITRLTALIKTCS